MAWIFLPLTYLPNISYFVAVVQLPTHVQLIATSLTAECQASLSLTISQSLLKFTSIESVRPSNYITLWCYLLLVPSVSQFSRSVMSNSLWPHGLQYTRPSCPSPTPGVYSNSYPLSQWCHPTISSSAVPFFSHFQSFPASGPFQISQFFSPGGQSIGVSAPVLPLNIQDWFPLGWTGWISLQSKEFSRVFSNTIVQKQSLLIQSLLIQNV